jgi:hypothetical protein
LNLSLPYGEGIMETIFDYYWHTSYDGNLDFWSVALWVGNVEYQISACMEGEVADYTVNLHNRKLQDMAYATYADNIEYSFAKSIEDFYGSNPVPLLLTEDEWFDYDDPYETT